MKVVINGVACTAVYPTGGGWVAYRFGDTAMVMGFPTYGQAGSLSVQAQLYWDGHTLHASVPIPPELRGEGVHKMNARGALLTAVSTSVGDITAEGAADALDALARVCRVYSGGWFSATLLGAVSGSSTELRGTPQSGRHGGVIIPYDAKTIFTQSTKNGESTVSSDGSASCTVQLSREDSSAIRSPSRMASKRLLTVVRGGCAEADAMRACGLSSIDIGVAVAERMDPARIRDDYEYRFTEEAIHLLAMISDTPRDRVSSALDACTVLARALAAAGVAADAPGSALYGSGARPLALEIAASLGAIEDVAGILSRCVRRRVL